MKLLETGDMAELERELKARVEAVPRFNADPEDVRRSVAKLVLSLVEFVRELLERQAVRRVENGTLTEDETEVVGRALMELEAAVGEIAGRFGLSREELNLELGPLGRLR